MAERKGEKAARGWWATLLGIALALLGFGVIIFEMVQVSPLGFPLNDITFAGIGLAGFGVAAVGIGIDRGAPG